MYNLIYSKKFKKAYKQVQKNKKLHKKLIIILYDLQKGTKLDARYKNHKLHGTFKDCFECHITPNLLLIYKIKKTKLEILLLTLGSHSTLFK